MGRQSNTDWGAIVGGIAVIGDGIALYIAREAALDKLLEASTEEAIGQILHSVPHMDDNTWELFVRGLEARAQHSAPAYRLFRFANDVRMICVAIDQMLSKPLSHAKMIVETTAREMDDATWNIFTYILGLRGQINMAARAIRAYAEQSRNAPLLAEELFRESLRAALADDVITATEASELEKLRQQLQLSADIAHRLLEDVRSERAQKSLLAVHRR
jgi:hypothetical protein